MQAGDRRLRPDNHQHQAVNCPRCDSLNTKFCYYNNYNLSQPRYFCKNCRRYWTKGGVLRNVPVGGGCRKNRRSKPKLKPEFQRGLTKSPKSDSSTDSSSAICRANDHPQIMDSMFTSEIPEFANLMSISDGPVGITGATETTMTFNQIIQSDGTMALNPTETKGSTNPIAALDWDGDAGTCLFDLHGEFWTQTTLFHPDHWSDNANSDIPLFLP